MIVGTAGHIDHGKTTLVRALTGVETDRLKEEKTRGISIELGYAYTPLENGDILGFIDVPGHEKLVHTMAAGATGIDFGLLVVAADDGVMPQTHEHLAILGLLGVGQGAIALTKVDRVDQARLHTVRAQLAALTVNSFLQDAPVFETNAAADEAPGVDLLRRHLHEAAQAMTARRSDGLFRLAVDRVFSLPGHGTVVTGTVHDGVVDVDAHAQLHLMPAGRPVRVRSIHAQNQPSAQGRAGQRCALNLGGLEREAAKRGDWIADARCFTPSRNVDVQLTLLDSADAAVKAWTPLHVHLGAAHYVAHAVPLSPDPLPVGQSGWVQLVFDEAVCAMPGDRFIVRNAQANRTIGGGMVLDANAPDRKRRSPQRLAWLGAVAQLRLGGGLSVLLDEAPFGLDEPHLMRLMGRNPQPQELPVDALWVQARGGSNPVRTLILQSHWDHLGSRAEEALNDFHERWPDEPGLDAARLRRVALPTIPETLWLALRDELVAAKRLVRNGPWLHRPGHEASLSAEETELAERLLPAIHAGAYDPPWVRDMAHKFDQPEDHVRQLLRKLVRSGQVYQVVRDLFYHRERVAQLAALLEQQGGSAGITAAQFRDATGLGRKRAVQILEFFDRAGYTRRLRDAHVPRGDSAAFWQRLS
ncbi:MAG TPA: selenocysteine-specific translation elongation factor [Pusillimonas sp.]|uniref:selenocysteine-specific translation elongation factor n=1 Tax=Pusillimonas sp. TaxID=3040095 RepID=UPI002D0EF2E7|nr:selenocysteine-specific translation elongation factor [Pusillimonas sp.]HUH87624.1 selenocysteine-specific translation elongation factor [Pusillimonas sp.]